MKWLLEPVSYTHLDVYKRQDVLIMLDQMMVLHDCESIVAQYKQEKLERLENRIVNIHDGEGGQ